MQKIQLYIEGVKVDMFKDESVSLTDTIKNIKDVSKIFTEFSKTFSLPATKINNKLFKHFYNFNIVGGFDARVRVSGKIELNYMPFKKGFVKLEGVSLKNNKAHTYKITFFGNTVSLKQKFGDDLLQGLTWLNNFNTKANGDSIIYNSDDVRDFLRDTQIKSVDNLSYIRPIQIPLLTHTQRLFYDSTTGHAHDDQYSGNLHYQGGGSHIHGVKWNELKYAINIPVVIKAIEETYNINFSNDFFTGTNLSYRDLYMWLHRVRGPVTSGGQTTTYTYYVDDWPSGAGLETGMSNSALFCNEDAVDQIAVLTLSPSDASKSYSFTVYESGVAIYDSGSGSGTRTHTINDPSSNPYTVSITVSESLTFTNAKWRVDGDLQGDGPFLDIYNTDVFIIPAQFEFSMTQQMPKMKVIDFVTGIFKMFNLVAYVDNDTGTIVVKTLDDFYSAGSSYDISNFIDVNTSEVNSALPFREVTYTYEGLETYLASVHSQLFAKEWGKEEFKNNVSTVFAGGIFNYTIPFEHLKFERLVDSNTGTNTTIQWGYSVDDNQGPYIGKPQIFYLSRKTDGYSFVDQVNDDNEPTSHVFNQTYFAPSNSNMNVLSFASQPSLNFFPETDEWQGTNNTNTLFNDYHKNYISGIFNTSKRLSKFTAYLPQRILLNLNLSDRLVINNQSYKINSITTNLLTGKSDIELLNE